jgi:hypothetical protein
LRSIVFISTAIYFFIIPVVLLINDISDPGLRNGEIPQFTYRWHKQLSKGMSTWAIERVATKKAATLNIQDVSGTEWPMFSAVYFLWATESLQKNWETNPQVSTVMPKDYAKDAIEAAVKLINDPNHAEWVRQHWGENYLHQENLFYRMLLISGLSSYQNLTANKQYENILIDQVESLSNELDASPYGLLDDYPGQCYPVDVLPAIAVIQRAASVLGLDYSGFVKRSLRAFQGDSLDKGTRLPAYIANADTGEGHGYARGVGMSYMLIWSPELWPEVANDWYQKYQKYFWQEGLLLSGFREFPRNSYQYDYFFDVDAGPVAAGYGVGASAFGIGAARVNNRMDHAYPLSAEALVSSWPLMNGKLLLPKLLSNLSDAPYLGESAMLFIMTRKPLIKANDKKEINVMKLPLFVYIVIFLYLFIGISIIKFAFGIKLKR